ncbi:uncharacterized protein LOC135350521 [Halichondria panicea]|uniref:uncharacterized protein LOC135350521 n=1 Tax=Halichondria panicea TaxID=6063 RepID=UPI00312B4C40
MAEETVTTEMDIQDPIVFLTSLRKACPDVISLLNSKQARLLSKSPTEPYDPKDINEQYLVDMASFFGMNQRVEDAERALRTHLLVPNKVKEEVDVASFIIKIQVLGKISKQFEKVITSKVKATVKEHGELFLPRIIRLCKKLEFTENETRIATYSLVIQSGYDRDGRLSGYGADVLSTCQFLSIPLQEMLVFLDQERKHMQQGFFPDVQDSYILNSSVTYDSDFCKALMGTQLKATEFLKIEQTILADVIAEEPGNQHYREEDITSPTTGKDDQPEVTPGDETPPTIDEDESEDPAHPMAIPVDTAEDHDPTLETPAAKVKLPKVKAGAEDEMDLDQLLRQERAREKQRKEDGVEEDEPEVSVEDEDTDKLKPYKKDLDYLDDHFQLIGFKLKVKGMDTRIEMEEQYDDGYRQNQRYQRQRREAVTKAKVQEKKCAKRLTLTRANGSWLPRLERMVESRKLCDFEKNVLLLLIGSVIQPNKFQNFEVRISPNFAQVGEVLRIFCEDLEEQIQHRRYFYKSSSLVHEGMIVVQNSGLTGDTTSATVEIDRRMLDFCVGLDTEFSEIVEGSHLYFPKTKFDSVILPKEKKELILSTVSNFEAYKRCRKKMGLDDVITYGAGMVLLFHGPPGTGKTMMANALANKLGKKVLLINFPSLGSMTAGENFKFIFRESKINDAILFFDECEAIFESRELGGHSVNLLLTEIERHDGLIILATNRPYDLDEAMHRRIMVAIEFRQPDHLLRKTIWQTHLPEQMILADDVDLTELALRFELTGGFIKNAILSALSIAVSRDGDAPIVEQKDLLQGANLQLRGRLRMKDFDRRVVPNAGLDEIIVEDDIMRQLKEIVQFEKARAVLFGQWGFARRNHQNLTILLHGPPGTGKSVLAEAIGYEVGKPLKVVNCGELLSKWVGESSKNIDSIFAEGRQSDAILVFDEAEGLFGQRTEMSTSTDRYANVDVGVLLYHIERYTGIIILTTNLIQNIDKAFFRRLRYILQLDVPSQELRVKLWKLIIPEEAPLADDVDYQKLAQFEMAGGNMKGAVFRAAARAALRDEEDRRITLQDLMEAAQEEVGKATPRMGFRRQDSDAARMFN